MENLRIGFIGLGNVGGKLAGNLLNNGADLTVRDLNPELVAEFVARGAKSAASPKEMIENCDVVITCLPSPAASAAVLEADDGIIAGMSPGKVWMEMSTTDSAEIKRLAPLVEAKGGLAMECPVSGGCHRAATGNIAIFAGGPRAGFERVLPVLTILGREVLHTGDLGGQATTREVTQAVCALLA